MACSIVYVKLSSVANASWHRRYDRSLKGRYRTLKCGAKRRGLELSLDFEAWLKIASQPCHYCQAPFEQDAGMSYRLDRVDNSQGYTPENVLPCCALCNLLRKDWISCDEMMVLMGTLKAYRQAKRVRR